MTSKNLNVFNLSTRLLLLNYIEETAVDILMQ